jgi:hypothetical protein
MDQAADQQLLTELEQDRDDLERMIAWVKSRMEQADASKVSSTPAKADGASPMRFPRLIAQDAFFRMSVPDAIKKYLNIVKRPKSAKDITAGLDTGGLTHQAKNLYATVYPTLLRMESSGEVARVGKGEWGLSEWYPNVRKTAQEEKTDSES